MLRFHLTMLYIYRNSLNGVTDAAYVTYIKNNPFLLDNEIKINTVYNLSGLPENWDIVSGVNVNGIHKDELEKFDDMRAFFTSGEAWYMGETVPIYQIVEANGDVKFIKKEKRDLSEDTDVWYLFYNKEIRVMFYR